MKEILRLMTRNKCPACKRKIIVEDDKKISYLIKILMLNKDERTIEAKCLYCKALLRFN